jgi:predicted enzyme related to lactoylglutathione lyase
MTSLLSYRPNLESRDVQATADFLADLLGLEIETVGEPPFLALLRSGQVGLAIVLAENPGVNSTTAGYLNVTDVDALHDHCRERGVLITTPLTDQPWGLRDFAIEIPGGHRIALGQRTASSSRKPG